jgi:hypothetical protein
VLLLERLVELLKPFVLGSETAFRSSVHDQHHLALVILEGDGLAFLCCRAVLAIVPALGAYALGEGAGQVVLFRGLKS